MKLRKALKKLNARLKDWEESMKTKSNSGGSQQRKDSGGYKKPGSMK